MSGDRSLGSEMDYDAHQSAKQGELTFTFQGGDPYSADFAELWAVLMPCDVKGLETSFKILLHTMQYEISLGNSFGSVQMDRGKVTKAYQLAIAIRDGDLKPDIDTDYDAHKTARPDELTFTLQSSDPYSADLVELWAALMTGNVNEVELRFTQLRTTMLSQIGLDNPYGTEQLNKGKVTKAYAYAKLLREQRHDIDIL